MTVRAMVAGVLCACVLNLGSGVLAHSTAAAANGPFIPRIVNSSTIPANGDLNPYGVAFVPEGFPGGGPIGAGDVLVSNFNNMNNLQGTGTTIIRLNPVGNIAPPMEATTFFTSRKQAGLSTALGVLRAGFVVVGNVPTTDGTINTIGAGALQVIDRHGRWLQTWTDPVFLDGPWDLTLNDHGDRAQIFVSNVLNGTVVRLDVTVGAVGLTLLHKSVIGRGYRHEPNAAALVLGPTGLALDASSGTLYVASSADNAIYAINQATTATGPVEKGDLVFASSHLRGPLALRFAPDGNLLTANGDAVHADTLHPSAIVEFTVSGQFVAEYNVDASQGGAFGIDTFTDNDHDADDPQRFNYAAVDDVTNNLTLYKLPAP